MKEYKALVIHPAARAFIVDLMDADSTLSALQQLVGGYIEGVPGIAGTDGYINENGKLDGSAFNEAATKLMHAEGLLLPRDWVAGSLVLVGTDDDGETVGLTDEQLAIAVLAVATTGCVFANATIDFVVNYHPSQSLNTHVGDFPVEGQNHE